MVPNFPGLTPGRCRQPGSGDRMVVEDAINNVIAPHRGRPQRGKRDLDHGSRDQRPRPKSLLGPCRRLGDWVAIILALRLVRFRFIPWCVPASISPRVKAREQVERGAAGRSWNT